MPPSVPTPDDLIDPEAPLPPSGEAVDTAAYAVPPTEGGDAPDLARPGAEDIIDVEAPPPANAAAVPPAEPAPTSGADEVLDRAADALLALAADRSWDAISLKDVADRAGLGFAELYARAMGKAALLGRLSDRYDRAALRSIEGDAQPAAHDRLFEAFMARLEAMQPHRDVLIAIGRAQPLQVALRLRRTARALAEGAGVDTSGGRGALRLAALAPAWARTLQVWRDDEGALNRTMAEIDKLLKRADGRLRRVGAGF